MPTTTNDQRCSGSTERSSSVCHYHGVTYTRFYQGMMLDAEDLSVEHEYHAHQSRLLARLMLGHGIVCGLTLEIAKDKCRVLTVKPGIAVDGAGRLIEVRNEVSVSLDAICGRGTDGCEDRRTSAPEDGTYVVVLEHSLRRQSLKPVVADSGSCQPICEPSRISEGFCIAFRCGQDHPPEDRCDCPQRASSEQDDEWQRLGQLRKALCSDVPCGNSFCEGVVLGRITISCDPCHPRLELDEGGYQLRRFAWTAQRLDRLRELVVQLACTPKKSEPKPDPKPRRLPEA
ncbi:MAG: hypothetical protein JNM84_25985 [Planctomycetes bacterium]|nr:hypothetical protein [Planctomycetota bacterium]